MLKEKAFEALAKVNLSNLANKNPRKISDGEAQRVAIARALVKKSELILAAEPTDALDEGTRKKLENNEETGNEIHYGFHIWILFLLIFLTGGIALSCLNKMRKLKRSGTL